MNKPVPRAMRKSAPQPVIADGDCQESIADKHNDDTGGDHFAISEFVGKDAAKDRQEVNECQETGKDVGSSYGAKAKFCLQEQSEDGKHGVVAETLSRVGKSEGIKSFGLILKHGNLLFM